MAINLKEIYSKLLSGTTKSVNPYLNKLGGISSIGNNLLSQIKAVPQLFNPKNNVVPYITQSIKPVVKSVSNYALPIPKTYESYKKQLSDQNKLAFKLLNIPSSGLLGGFEESKKGGMPQVGVFKGIAKGLKDENYYSGQKVEDYLKRLGSPSLVAGLANLATEVAIPGPGGEISTTRRVLNSLPDDLKPFAEKAIKMSKKDYIKGFSEALSSQNKTLQETASNVVKTIEKSGFKDVSSFYDYLKTGKLPSSISKATKTELPKSIKDISEKDLDVVREYPNIKPTKLNKTDEKVLVDRALIMAEDKTGIKSTISKGLGSMRNAELTGYEFGKKFPLVGKKNAVELMSSIERGDPPKRFQELADAFRKLDDEVYNMAKANNLDINYAKNHISHIWKEDPATVSKRYIPFKQKYGLSNSRTIPSYEEGIKMGLTPKYTEPRQILAYQVQELEKTKAGIRMFEELKAKGLIVPPSVGIKNGFEPVRALGFPRSYTVVGKDKFVVGEWYAPKEVAEQISKVFGAKDIDKFLNITSKISGVVQDVALSGGLPFTPLNAWTASQTLKELLSGRIASPLASFVKAVFNPKYLESKIEVIKRMQSLDIPINTSMKIDDLLAPSEMGNVGNLWNKAVNEPTFKRFMPSLQIRFFEDIENGLLKKGINSDEASRIAAQATKNFYGLPGLYSEATRNPNTQALVQTLFMAPKFRETMINFWWNSVKGLRKPFSPENINNTKFLAGAAITLAVMNGINQALNGKNMLENPTGMEDKLLIPIGKITNNPNDKTVIGIPWLSSVATMPRLAFRTGKNIVTGKFKEAGKDLTQTLAAIWIKPVIDVFNNMDYFGKPIVKDGTTIPEERWKQIGSYLGTQYLSHPYLKEIFDKRNSKDPIYQRISRALELPIRYYDTDSIEAKYYYQAKDSVIKGLNTEEKAAFDAIPRYNPQDPNAEMFKYQIYMKYPNVFKAKQQIAVETAKNNNQVVDPLYLAPYSVVKNYIHYQTYEPGSADGKAFKKAHPEVVGLASARGKYFESLKEFELSGTSAPKPSEYVQQQMGVKNWNDPQVKSYLDSYNNYINDQRTKLGLSPVESYGSYKKKFYFKKISAPKLKAVKLKMLKFKKPKFKKSKVVKLKKPKLSKIKILKTKKVKFA